MKISKYYRTILRLGLNASNHKCLVDNNFSLFSQNCVG